MILENMTEADLVTRLRGSKNKQVVINLRTIQRASSGKQLEKEIAYLSLVNNLLIFFGGMNDT